MFNKFLFEARPDIIPDGRLTWLELELWGLWFKDHPPPKVGKSS